MTSWHAPYSGGKNVILPGGVEFTINNQPLPGATAVYCNIIDYEKWESVFVSEDDRKNKKYSGYYLCINIKIIETQCEKILNH